MVSVDVKHHERRRRQEQSGISTSSPCCSDTRGRLWKTGQSGTSPPIVLVVVTCASGKEEVPSLMHMQTHRILTNKKPSASKERVGLTTRSAAKEQRPSRSHLQQRDNYTRYGRRGTVLVKGRCWPWLDRHSFATLLLTPSRQTGPHIYHSELLGVGHWLQH